MLRRTKLLSYEGVRPLSLIQGKTLVDGVRKQSAEENIGTQEWGSKRKMKKVQNGKVYNSYSSQNIPRRIDLWRMKWAGHAALMVSMKDR
jgi:hypothetical protein